MKPRLEIPYKDWDIIILCGYWSERNGESGESLKCGVYGILRYGYYWIGTDCVTNSILQCYTLAHVDGVRLISVSQAVTQTSLHRIGTLYKAHMSS
jgi:hypothetical protein